MLCIYCLFCTFGLYILYSFGSWCAHLIGSLLLIRHIILETPIRAPTPRVQKKINNMLNISTWVYHLNKKTPTELTAYLNNIFESEEYEQDTENINTWQNFRLKLTEIKKVKRQKPFEIQIIE